MEGCRQVLLAAVTHPSITVVGKVIAHVKGQCTCPWLVGDLGLGFFHFVALPSPRDPKAVCAASRWRGKDGRILGESLEVTHTNSAYIPLARTLF